MSLYEWVSAWGPLSTNVLLAVITGWYAFLTRKMSQSAAQSADSAEKAVQASVMANEILISQMDVQFALKPFYGTPLGGLKARYENGVAGLWIKVDGASIVLHEFTLDYAYIEQGAENYRGAQVRRAPSEKFPISLHAGEDIVLTFDAPQPVNSSPEASKHVLPLSAHGKAVELHCTATYSLGFRGDKINRKIKWVENPI